MAKEVCVFCGEEVGSFGVKTVSCGPVFQYACKSCAKEVETLGEAERCRRALQRGLASSRERLEEYVATVESAEEARPACLRCGEKIYFGQVETLDNSPLRDGMLSSTFDVLPAYCKSCGKIELYNPSYIGRNKLLSYLVRKDNGEIK